MILFIFVLVLLDRLEGKKKKKEQSEEEFRPFPEASLSSRMPVQVGCRGGY